MKLITFSIWGVDLKYLSGAIRNAELAQSVYPDWVCRFYVDSLVPFFVIDELSKFENVQIVMTNELGDWKSSFYRFGDIDDDDVEVQISRDSDSRLSTREKAAVDQWLASDNGFHIMKDHPWHYTHPILAGMWGIKSDVVQDMKKKIAGWDKTNTYHSDQNFLRDIIYPEIKNNCLIHDDFKAQPFPAPRGDVEFIGQVFDENEETVREHLDALRVVLGK